MKIDSQGIFVSGVLAFIKYNEQKNADDKIIPASQTLQISVLTNDGFYVVNVKDTDFLVKSDLLQKPVLFRIGINSFNNSTYYKLLEIL